MSTIKRIIIVLMLICTVFTGCENKASYTIAIQPTPLSNTIVKNPDDIMLFSFEDGSGDETLYNGPLQSLDLTDAPWEQCVIEPLSVSSNTDTGHGLKIPLNNLKDAWFQILRSSTPEEYRTNIDSHKYLRLWVSNVGEGTLTLSVLLSAGMYYFSFLNADGAIVTSSDGTLLNVEKVFTVDKFIPEAFNYGCDSVVLPADFSGWVAFPLLEETINYWTTTQIEKLSNATTIDLRVLSEQQKTEYYIIDDICLTDNEKGTIRFE